LVGHARSFRAGARFDQASASLDAVEAASAGVGAVNLDVDSDGKVRRMPLVFRLRDKAVPSLDAEMLRLVEDKSAITLKSDDGNSGLFSRAPGVASVDTARGELATAPDGSLWIAYSGVHPERNVSASALIDKTLAPGALRGAIVYIGAPDELVETPAGPVRWPKCMRKPPRISSERGVAPAGFGSGGGAVCLALFGLGCVFVFARLGMRWAGLFRAVRHRGSELHLLAALHGPTCSVRCAGPRSRIGFGVAGGRRRALPKSPDRAAGSGSLSPTPCPRAPSTRSRATRS